MAVKVKFERGISPFSPRDHAVEYDPSPDEVPTESSSEELSVGNEYKRIRRLVGRGDMERRQPS